MMALGMYKAGEQGREVARAAVVDIWKKDVASVKTWKVDTALGDSEKNERLGSCCVSQM